MRHLGATLALVEPGEVRIEVFAVTAHGRSLVALGQQTVIRVEGR